MVSGGKDSLYMLYQIFQHPDKYPLDGVCHLELEIDFPFIKDVVGEMKAICDMAGVKFFSFKPDHTWLELYEKYGYPNRHKRWCNDSYKLSGKKKLNRFLREQGKYLVEYIGFCADEVDRFRYELNDRGQKVKQIYPLAELGINEDYIWKWAREHPVFNDFYKYNYRCGCMCCPLSARRGLAYVKQFYPEKYEYFMGLADKFEEESGYTVWDGKHKYNTKYVMKRVERLLPLKELEVK